MSEVLRLHVAGKTVWWGSSSRLAEDSGDTPARFVRREVFLNAKAVRLLGCHGNADLIVEAHEQRERGVLRPGVLLLLGSPAICYRRERLDDPHFVLQRLWQPGTLGTQAGCWHHLTVEDYRQYLLASRLAFVDAEATDLVRATFRSHPAYPAISFLPTCSVESAIKLVCEILDPRWYNHPGRPHRVSRLFSYLGLAPCSIESLWTGLPCTRCAECSRIRRATMLVDAWTNSYRGDSCPEDRSHPGNFLWRIFDHAGGGPKGLLKATEKFTVFLRLVWLHGLDAGEFDPVVFFKRVPEYEAYQQHVMCLP